MSIHVYHQGLYNDLLASAEPAPDIKKQTSSSPFSTTNSDITSHQSTRPPSSLRASTKRLELFWEEAQRIREQSERHLREKVARKQKHDEEAFARMLTSLEQESSILHDIDDYLALKDQHDFRRSEQLYKSWCERVFGPIQTQINEQLDAVDVQQIEKRRREMFDQYLSESNKKKGGAVFRDTILPSDYDPLLQRSSLITYSTRDVSDPLKHDEEQSWNETQIIAPETKLVPPRQRDVLDIRMWDKLEATPHGRYTKLIAHDDAYGSEGKAKHHHVRVIKGVTHSTMVLDHYNVPRDPLIAQSQYFSRGKKRDHVEPQHDYSIINNQPKVDRDRDRDV